SRALNFAGLDRQLRESGDQFYGEIVDAVVTQVFEGLQRGGLAGAAHPGDDDQLGAAVAIVRCFSLLVFGFCDPARRHPGAMLAETPTCQYRVLGSRVKSVTAHPRS